MVKLNAQNRAELLTKVERYTEVPMLVLVVVMIVTLVIPMVVALPEAIHQLFELIDWIIWGLFALELLVRTYIAPRKLAYLQKNWVDVLVVALPVLRVFRIFRVARLARGARLVRALRFVRILMFFGKFIQEVKTILSRHGFNYLFVVFLGLIGLGTVLVYHFDQGVSEGAGTIDKSLWLVTTNAFSGGFANIYPGTPEAKALSIVLIVVGTILVSYFTASLASYFTEKGQDVEQERIEQKIDMLTKRLEMINKKLG